MLVIRGKHNLKKQHRGCVATIGNFDGVHLGHQSVLNALKIRAKELNLPSMLITFEPQPLEYFKLNEAPARLTRVKEKLELLRGFGLNRVLLLKFNKDLAFMEPENFIKEILIAGLDIKHLYVGDDFHFGKNRAGDFDLLKQFGSRHGFFVENLATISDQQGRISSTRIRKELSSGNFDVASKCLGRSYSMSGKVEHGYKNGRAIGFPTINIRLARLKSPLFGVFAVFVNGLDEEPVSGVASIGNRPILNEDDRVILEVHLFNFQKDVYGKNVSVRFIEKLRDQMPYDSFDALQEQISIDAKNAIFACKNYLKSAN